VQLVALLAFGRCRRLPGRPGVLPSGRRVARVPFVWRSVPRPRTRCL